MIDEASYLTRAQALSFAASRGYKISDEKWHRWRHWGLIPSPVLKGQGQGPGILALYPPSTGQQLVDVAQALTDKKRSLHSLQWSLWWSGREVQPQKLRQHLQREIKNAQKLRSEVRAIRNSAAAFARFDKRNRVRQRSGSLLSIIRRQLGKERFITFQFQARAILAGLYDSRESVDLEDWRKYMPWTTPDDVQQISKWCHPMEMARALRRTTDVELLVAREELRPLLTRATEIGTSNPQARIGPARGESVGLLFSQIVHELPQGLFLSWLRARQVPDFQQRRAQFSAFLDRPANEWPLASEPTDKTPKRTE
jgi:hypothetical protein